MDSRIKLIVGAVLGLVLILGLASVGKQIFETNDAGYYQIKQASLSGEMTVIGDPGTYLQMFANITTYQISDVYYFSKTEGEGGVQTNAEPIKVRFNDGGTAEVSGMIKFRLPTDPEKRLALHRDFKNFEAIKHDMMRQAVTEALMQTAPLMRAEDSYSTRRSEFTDLAEDQVVQGIFETVSKEYKDKDADGNEFIVAEVNVKLDEKKQPIVRKISPLKQYGIEVIQFVIKDIDFDQTIDALISKKKEAEQQKVVARANAEKAKQDAITAREQGNASIATEKAKQDVEKIKEVTIAQKEYEVAQLAAKRAKEEAEADIVKGRALAEISRLKVAAGLTPLERATIEKETKIGVAAELAKVQFPGMMIIGGGGNGGATNPFDAVGLESFMRINERLNKQAPVQQKLNNKKTSSDEE